MADNPSDTSNPEAPNQEAEHDPRLQAAAAAEQGPMLQVLNSYLQDRVTRLRAELTDALAALAEAHHALEQRGTGDDDTPAP